jgi:hypothetical protein
MPFLTKGKANWKYILIVVILAAIVGGGIWIYQEQFPKFIKLSIPKKPITSKEYNLGLDEEAKIIYEFKIPETGVEKRHEYKFYLYTIDPNLKRVEVAVLDLGTNLFCDKEYGLPSRQEKKITLALGERVGCLVTEEGGTSFKLIDIKENKAKFETSFAIGEPHPLGPFPPKEIIIEKVPAEPIEVNLSPDFKTIQVKKEGQLFYIYTIEQWQEWAKKNWSTLKLKPIIMGELGVIGDEPEDFVQFNSASLSLDKIKIAFAISSKEIALSTFSITGVLNLETKEVTIIPNILGGSVEKIIWSPNSTHFAYTIGTARAEGDKLSLDDVLNKKNNFVLDGERIGTILGETSPVHFIPQFRDLRWSFNGEKLYFKTNGKGSSGETEWVIDVDGTGLKKATDETANWKTYSNPEVDFTFKYPPDWEIKQEYQYKSTACQADPNCKGVRYIFLNRIDDTRSANMGEKDKFGIAINMPQCTGVKWSDLPGNNWICVFDEKSETLEIFNQMLSTFRFLK